MQSKSLPSAGDALHAISILLGAAALGVVSVGNTFGDGPADNQTQNVRPIPPSGIAIHPESREALEASLKQLEAKIETLRGSKDPNIQRYLPDVEIFPRAVSIALTEDGFFEAADVDRAQSVLKEGLARADALAAGAAPWRQTGHRYATVRGFRSKLDGTVQPYGVVLNTFPHNGQNRADVWCRGRSVLSCRKRENLPTSDSKFLTLTPRMVKLDQFCPRRVSIVR
jgi:hypothetical protein